MPWIQWYHPFPCIFIPSQIGMENVLNFAIFKPPPADLFIYSQDVFWADEWTYLMRQIQFRHRHCHRSPGCGHIAKIASDSLEICVRQAVLRTGCSHTLFSKPHLIFPHIRVHLCPEPLLSLRDGITCNFSENPCVTHEICEIPRECCGCNPSSQV